MYKYRNVLVFVKLQIVYYANDTMRLIWPILILSLNLYKNMDKIMKEIDKSKQNYLYVHILHA